MIWKELTCTLSRRQRLALRLTVGIEILLIGIAYSFPVIMPAVGYAETHLLFLWAFLGFGVLFTVSTSATLISTERESRTWPLLLVSPLHDRDILIGKSVGVLRRCGPVWLPLFAYVAAFAYADCFHGWAVIQTALIIVSALVFLTATGFYFGSRLDRTTEAVTANLMLAGVVWCVLPLIGHWAAVIRGSWDDGQFFAGVPFVQVLQLMRTTLEGADGYYYLHRYGYRMNALNVTVSMLVSTLVHTGIALLFLVMAVRAFRRRIV
jgi:ABC-type transport system involved in multi-copper enzyme maturation permease subunit